MSEATPGTARRPISVLLVEDDEAFSYGASRYLQTMGCHVTPVLNGTLALNALDNATFDVLVIDCVMPPGTLRGVALGRMIRFRGTKVPMIFITAHPDITAAEGELPGPILRKPIELLALYTAIISILA